VFTDFITGLNLSQALEHSIDVAELDAPLVQQASVNAEAEAEAELQLQLQLPELPVLEVLPDLVW
jgi:hypothetical protein